METHHFLAFDCGATSGRAILGPLEGGRLSMKEVYRFPNRTLEIGGKYYWNVYSIYEHFLECLTRLGREGVRPDSIGIDTWGVDFGCIAADGSLLGLPRAYRDPYTAGIPEEVFGIVPRAELYGTTGIQIMDFNTVFQLYAQEKEGSTALREAEALLFMPDLLSYMLTGNRVCEYTDASTSGMMNQRTRSFEKPLLERLGLDPSKLLPVIQPGTHIGVLRPSIARATGLGPVPVIAVAGHDTASAIAAVPAADGRFAYLSSGTWSLMGIELEAPVMTAESARLNFTNEGGIEGTTRFLKNITGMWLLEQCRTVWAREGREYTYPELTEMARAAAAFPSVVNPDDPRFANPADMAAEIRSALRESGQAEPATDGEMVACIYHSLTRRYREVLEMLRGFASFPVDKLHVIGGGSANDLMSQWTADALGIPVIAGPVEATAIGNLLVQAKAAGLAADRWEMRRIVAESFYVKTFHPSI